MGFQSLLVIFPAKKLFLCCFRINMVQLSYTKKAERLGNAQLITVTHRFKGG